MCPQSSECLLVLFQAPKKCMLHSCHGDECVSSHWSVLTFHEHGKGKGCRNRSLERGLIYVWLGYIIIYSLPSGFPLYWPLLYAVDSIPASFFMVLCEVCSNFCLQFMLDNCRWSSASPFFPFSPCPQSMCLWPWKLVPLDLCCF